MEEDFEGKTQILEQLLNEKRWNERAEQMAQDSKVKHKVQRTNTADVDSLSNQKKGKQIEKVLSQKHRKRRKKMSMNDFKAETARILEEFLQAQLDEQSVQTKRKQYQRYVEVSVAETTTPSGESSGYLASNSNLLRTDSIPYADESDQELRKAESLPHDELAELYKQNGNGAIHHEKSKSAPHQPVNDTEDFEGWRPRVIRPTPPAPPGTPHSPSLQSSSDALSKPVPYTGLHGNYESARQSSSSSSYLHHDNDRKESGSAERSGSEAVFSMAEKENRERPQDESVASPKVPDSLPIANQNLPNRSVTPYSASSGTQCDTTAKSPSKLVDGSMSGFDTDSDSDGEKHFYAEGRKKKSVFKKAQERLSSFLRLHKKGLGESEDHENGLSTPTEVVKPKYKKPKDKSVKNIPEDVADVVVRKKGDVVEERDINFSRHIRQTHGGRDRKTVIRTEDSFEVIDQVSDSGKKHTEICVKVKESSSGGAGFFGKHLTRFKSKKDKRSIKGKLNSQNSLPSLYFNTCISWMNQ